MNKILIAFVLIVSFSESILSQERWTGRTYLEECQKAKETTDEDFLTN